MPGTITLTPTPDLSIVRVELANPGKLNAIDVSMWQALQSVFEELQARPVSTAPDVVIVSGAGGQFASGGDIHEFASFRFDVDRLRHFHERVVAPALHAMIDCDIPLFAQIEGACIGGGLEIAACCDIRICGSTSRFGVPIAKLGFPMAPGELELVSRIVPEPALREMLLEARLMDASRALQSSVVHAVVADADVASATQDRARRLAGLSAQALRMNKQSLRRLHAGGPTPVERRAHFEYAPSAEHVEGIAAFIERRPPRFDSR